MVSTLGKGPCPHTTTTTTLLVYFCFCFVFTFIYWFFSFFTPSCSIIDFFSPWKYDQMNRQVKKKKMEWNCCILLLPCLISSHFSCFPMARKERVSINSPLALSGGAPNTLCTVALSVSPSHALPHFLFLFLLLYLLSFLRSVSHFQFLLFPSAPF